MSRGALMLMRPVPGPSPIHSLWAGTKLVIVLAISVLLTIAPTWPVIGLTALLILLAAALAHIPYTCIPSVPRWLWIVFVAGSLFTIISGGAPTVQLGSVIIGMGGFVAFARITALGVVLLGLGAVVSWTTQVADIAPAIALLGRPLRWLRLPVDDWAVTIALAFRLFPMLADEFRLLTAARRMQPPRPEKQSRRSEAVDLCTAVMVSALRRAAEMGDAIAARGGAGRISARSNRPGWPDVVATTTVVILFGLILGLPMAR